MIPQELQQKISSFLTNELASLASQLASSLESLSFQAGPSFQADPENGCYDAGAHVLRVLVLLDL